MKDILLHLFLPHHTNNHRAKFLHHRSLLLLIGALFLTSFFISLPSTRHGSVLGVSSNISVSDLLALTNQKRVEQGLSALALNSELSTAAQYKAQDMFAKNYWAHNSPDGTTPWVFIKSSGYDYLYAGENLARGFYTSSDVVEAWMASPGHRENIMSSNYDEIGFAILDGNLTGDETVLVVQMFGRSKAVAAVPQTDSTVENSIPQIEEGTLVDQEPVIEEQPEIVVDEAQPLIQPQQSPQNQVASIQSQPLIDTGIFSKTSSLIILSTLLALLLLDIVLIERRRIVRILTHNIDHVLFLGVVFVVIILIGNGAIL